MRIDSHQHFWRYEAGRHNWITEEMAVLKRDFLPGQLLAELEGNRMDGCVAVQVEHSEADTTFLLDLASRHREIVGVVGWVDLTSPDVANRLQHFSQFSKLRGFRHLVQAEPDDHFMLRPEFLRGIGALHEFGFTYDILIYPRQLPAAIELVGKFPEQPFVVDHIAKPAIKDRAQEGRDTSSPISGPDSRREWAGHMRTLASFPNVYCKVSGMITEADWRHWQAEDFTPFLDVVFEAFGCDRVMFGSDWPVCLLAGDYRRVKALVETYTCGLSRQQTDNIFGLNAARFYGLEN